jgi:hypothetical protein
MTFEEACRRKLERPALSRGDIRTGGRYFRNLRKDDIAKRRQEDPNDDPPHGRLVKPRHWKDAGRHSSGLSVNAADCMKSPTCSIELNRSADEFFHVLEIDLRALADELAVRSNGDPDREPHVPIAQYSPLAHSADGVENPCHFDILPLSSRLPEFLLAMHDLLEGPFKELIPMKGRESEFQTAEEQYCRCAILHEYVRDKNATLRWLDAT